MTVSTILNVVWGAPINIENMNSNNQWEQGVVRGMNLLGHVDFYFYFYLFIYLFLEIEGFKYQSQMNQVKNQKRVKDTPHSSYHAWTNMSVEGVLFEASTYIVYLRERFCFPLLCTFKKVIKSIDVKIDVQKGTMRCKRNLTINVLVSSNTCSHRFLSHDSSPHWLPYSFLLRFAFGFQVFTDKTFEVLMGFLELCSTY